MDAEILERLAGAGINLLPMDLERHYVFERDGFIALVERRGEGLGAVGAAGLLTPGGLAPLVWRESTPVFVSKTNTAPATDSQLLALRSFQSDLQNAIR